MQNSHCLVNVYLVLYLVLVVTLIARGPCHSLHNHSASFQLKKGKFYNFPIFRILLPPKLPDRVKPECRVNLSVDKAGKAVSRHISFYQRIPEVVIGVVCSFFNQFVCSCFYMEGLQQDLFLFVEDIDVSFRRAFHIFYSEYYTLELQTKSRYFKLQRAS